MFITRNFKTDNLFNWLGNYVLLLFLLNEIVAIAYGYFYFKFCYQAYSEEQVWSSRYMPDGWVTLQGPLHLIDRR